MTSFVLAQRKLMSLGFGCVTFAELHDTVFRRSSSTPRLEAAVAGRFECSETMLS